MADTGRTHRLAGIVTALLPIAFGLTSCGGGSEDAAKIEAELKTEYQSELGDPSLLAVESVQCPDDLELAGGEEFECTVTTDDGETTMGMRATEDASTVDWYVLEASSSGESDEHGTVSIGETTEPAELP